MLISSICHRQPEIGIVISCAGYSTVKSVVHAIMYEK